jgi:hypothetical protein
MTIAVKLDIVSRGPLERFEGRRQTYAVGAD